MTEEEIIKRIQAGRQFMKVFGEDENYESDQQLKKPQPPLVKAPMTEGPYISLSKDFKELHITHDVLSVFANRQSHRIYDREAEMPLLNLSWLLWSTQGVKEIRGKSYATLRTVASGGARHPFETYMFIRNVESLDDGLYHYLPMEHALECIQTKEELEASGTSMFDLMSKSVCGQAWAGYSNVLFIYSMVPYRAEWRYGIDAHRPALIDAGHVTGNLYLACTAIDMGTCAIAAVDVALCDELIGLDGDEEFSFYAATAGMLKEEDKAKEDDIYAFVKEQGL